MLEKIKELYFKYKKLTNYVAFGILTSIVNFAVKYILLFLIFNPTNWLELQISIILSWIAAVVFAYFTNRKFVFASKNKNLLKEFLSFVAGRLLTLLIEMFIMWFFITFLKLNSDFFVLIFTLVSQIFVIVGNYIFSKMFVFKNNHDNKMGHYDNFKNNI